MHNFDFLNELTLDKPIFGDAKGRPLTIKVSDNGIKLAESKITLSEGQRLDYVRVYKKKKFDNIRDAIIIVIGERTDAKFSINA